MSSRHSRSSNRGRGRHAQAHAAALAAAAAEQARQQLLDAASHPAPKHTYSSDDEEDEDFAEFKKQAAQLAEQAKPQPVLPEGLEPGKFAAALQQLQQHLGISQNVATDALLATAEQHWRNYEAWLDEAQMFLACRQETDIEAEKMREAMEASIRERDQQQQEEEQSRPELTNLSEERLRKRFAGSAVLQQLSSAVPGAVLFCDHSPLFELTKCQLVALLRLEERCCKWWPGQGTINYFNKFAGDCVSKLQSGSATRSSCTHIPVIEAAGACAQEHQQVQQQQPEPVVQQQQQHEPAGACTGKEAQQQQLCSPSPQQEQPPQQRQCTDPTAMLPPPELTTNTQAGSVDSDSRPHGCSHLSAGSSAPSAAAGERRCSTRKRQAPGRYRSASPQVSAQHTGRSKKGSTPPPAAEAGAVEPSCSSEPKSKQARLCPPADMGSRSASEPAIGLQPSALGRSASSAAAANSCARAGSCSAAAAAAHGTGMAPRDSAVYVAQDVLQLQLIQLQQATQQAAGCSSSSLSSFIYKATVLHQLSKLLADECEALQSMIYSFPTVAGAVPAIFKADESTAAAADDDDGSDSDVEMLADIAPAAAAAAAAATGPGLNSPAALPADQQYGEQANHGGHTAAAAAAALPAVPGSPPDSPPPRLPEQQHSLFAAAEHEQSPSVEIISD